MRQFVIDELRPEEVDRIEEFISQSCEKASLGRLYWLDMPDDLLAPMQYEHRDTCAPYSAAIELADRKVIFELLIRSRQKLRCSCIGYANEHQRQFILNFADTVISQCGIKA